MAKNPRATPYLFFLPKGPSDLLQAYLVFSTDILSDW